MRKRHQNGTKHGRLESPVERRIRAFQILLAILLLVAFYRTFDLARKATAEVIAADRAAILHFCRWLPQMRANVADRAGRLVAETRQVDGKWVRAYPFGKCLNSVVGQASPQVGEWAVEEYQTHYGVPNQRGWLSFLLGDPIFTVGPAPGMQLTIDAVLQKRIHRLLAQRGEPACVVLIKRDGDILAMASFDPKDPADRRNLCLDPIPIGSTIKPLLVALYGAEFGHPPAAGVTCRKGLRRFGRWYGCWRNHGYVATWQDYLLKSCNAVSVARVTDFDPYHLASWFHRIGLVSTEVEGLNCPPGQMRLPDQTPADQAYVGMGATIAVTPLALCRVYAGLVNGGVIPQPRLIAKVNSQPTPQHSEQVLPPIACQEVTGVLREVVQHGTARRIRHTSLLGKTGTTEIVDEGPLTGLFAWAAPFPNPKVVGVVVLRGTPNHSHQGHEAAAVAAQVYEIYRQVR